MLPTHICIHTHMHDIQTHICAHAGMHVGISLSLSLCLSLSLSLSVFLSLSLSTSTLLTLSTCSWQGQEFGLEDSQVPQAPGTSSHLRQAYHPVSRTVMRAYKHYNDDTR